MGKTLADILTNTILEKTIDTLHRPSVPVDNADATKVATQVTTAIKPVIINATNSEPFYRSRIFLGLGAAALSFITSRVLGFTVGEGDFKDLVDIGLMLSEAGGLGYAWYGRVVGASKKPLGA